jgi:hypothetical protein
MSEQVIEQAETAEIAGNSSIDSNNTVKIGRNGQVYDSKRLAGLRPFSKDRQPRPESIRVPKYRAALRNRLLQTMYKALPALENKIKDGEIAAWELGRKMAIPDEQEVKMDVKQDDYVNSIQALAEKYTAKN